jgi:hypothetical protein
MYTGIESQPSCATAWLKAVNKVAETGDAFNVIVDIADPVNHSDSDHAVITTVDQFLRQHEVQPIISVANTIFPQDLCRRHGADGVYDAYVKAYGAIKHKRWGRYFERMTSWPAIEKRSGVPTKVVINPLRELIAFMKKQVHSKLTFHNVYELTLYDPARDRRIVTNRQCLSFLSFKLDHDNRLLLTAMYRNHYYLERALGNFIGLGRLMHFIAGEVGVPVGSLTCVSTHAVFDCEKWGKREAHRFLKGVGEMSARQVGATNGSVE